MIIPAAPSQRKRAIGMLLLANLLWGLSFPIIKALVFLNERLIPRSSGGFVVAAIGAPRFFLATVAMLAWHAWRRRRGPGISREPFIRSDELAQGLILGFFTGIGMLLQNDGLRFTTASTSAFLTQFYAITIPLWLAIRHRKVPGPIVWASCVLVLAGAAILGHFDWRDLRLGRGELETILASVFFMGQILWLDHPGFDGNRASRVTLVMFATETVLFGALALSTMPSAGVLGALCRSPAWIGLSLLLTLPCTLGAFSLMVAWQPKITATEAGLIYCVEPIFGSLFALCLPALISSWAGIAYANEAATWNLLLGGGLVTFANGLVQLKSPNVLQLKTVSDP